MFLNSSHLQVYKLFNIGIANTVCAFLNTNGGRVICLNSGKPFKKEEDVKSYSERVKDLLKSDIFNYPDNKIEYRIVQIEKSYFLDLIIEKSNQFHKVNSNQNYYIRSGKENKKYDIGLNFGIRPIVQYMEKYYKIGDFATGSNFYKYMSLENALQCLWYGNIWFVEPSKWNDKYEVFFYKATIDGSKCTEKTPIVYTTCVTNKKDSESAWKIYAYNSEGLASRCVEFILDRTKLRETLLNTFYKIDPKKTYSKKLTEDYNIFEGTVIYKDEQIIEQLPKSKIKRTKTEVDNDWYHAYFDTFSFDKYMNLLLLKRSAFDHEKETRLFVVKKDFDTTLSKGEGHIEIQIPWKDILKGVRYDVNCSPFEKKLLEEELKKCMGLDSTELFSEDFIFEKYDVYKKGHKPATITT